MFVLFCLILFYFIFCLTNNTDENDDESELHPRQRGEKIAFIHPQNNDSDEFDFNLDFMKEEPKDENYNNNNNNEIIDTTVIKIDNDAKIQNNIKIGKLEKDEEIIDSNEMKENDDTANNNNNNNNNNNKNKNKDTTNDNNNESDDFDPFGEYDDSILQKNDKNNDIDITDEIGHVILQVEMCDFSFSFFFCFLFLFI